MNLREQFQQIGDLHLNKLLSIEENGALPEEYMQSIGRFVERFPMEEAALRTALGKRNSLVASNAIMLIKALLEDIYADNMANICWQYWRLMNGFENQNPERAEAYISILLSSITSLSIDIQMAILKEGRVISDPNECGCTHEYEKYILAVDDDTYCLDTFKNAFKEVDCKIICVTSGKSALDVLNLRKPCLFVLDIEMPEMNGIELAENIKKQGHDAPVVFITGNATKENVTNCFNAGAVDFIVKPINPKDIVDKISKFL